MIITAPSLSHNQITLRQLGPKLAGGLLVPTILIIQEIDMWPWSVGILFFVMLAMVYELNKLPSQHIHYLQLESGQINLKGDKKGQKFEAQLSIDSINASIHLGRHSRQKTEYYIKLESPKSTFEINRNEVWDYRKLMRFYLALKEAQGQALSNDEKDYLKRMHNRAEGLTNLQELMRGK